MQTLTAERKELFLAELKDGQSVAAAAKSIGLTRQSMYKNRAKDPEFAAAWDDAVETGTDTLEDVAIKRAKESSDVLLIFMLKSRRPDKYKDRAQVDTDTTVRVISSDPMTDDEWQTKYQAGLGSTAGTTESSH